MKVLIVSNMWPSSESPTRGLFVREQARSLESVGVDVSVFHFDARVDKLNYAKLPLRLARRIVEDRPDIVHAHYGLTGAFCLGTLGRPLVTTLHGSDVYIAWQRRLSRWAAKRSAATICVSRALDEALGISGVTVLPCGVDTERFRPRERIEARRKLGLPLASPIVLFPASRRNPAKNFSLFASAMDRLDTPSVVTRELVGVAREDVPWVMSAADVMVVTSHYEGYCLAVTEALACGLPVLSVDVADISRRLEGVPHCRTVARDPQIIARTIDEVLVDRPRISPVPRLRGLTSADVAHRLQGLYRELLS